MKMLIQHLLILIFLSKAAGAGEIFLAQVGDDVTLTVSKPSSNVYMYWYKKDTEIASINNLGGKFPAETSLKKKLIVGDNSLTIKSIGENDFGKFKCEIKDSSKNPQGTPIEFNVIKLKVGVNPTEPLLPSQTATLTCEVETPPGLAKITTKLISPHGNEIPRGKHVIEAKSQNSGLWTCVANNKKKVSISVSVVDFQTPTLPYQYTSENSPFLVPFSIPPNIQWDYIKNVTQKIEWFFTPKTSSVATKLFSLSMKEPFKPEVGQGRNLKHFNFNKGDFSLGRNKGQKDDAGTYTCSITFNDEKTRKSTRKFEVLQIIPYPGAQLTSGQKLKLSCTTGEPLAPDMQLKWVFPQKSPRLPPDQHSANLTFPEVRIDDSGNWECELWWNNTSLASAVIRLQIEPILNTWQLVVVCVVGVILLVLLVFIFIRCRRHQKPRRLRHQFCRCKNPQPKGFYRT
ncbi:carcinoembryonic antigen-related cell adhesion molecule 5 isoform X1 [Oryzias latipes]|nr:carcinoembryonic antigen-related cell adhesion molecule 5 isoform X1 [Oryzias latipes]